MEQRKYQTPRDVLKGAHAVSSMHLLARPIVSASVPYPKDAVRGHLLLEADRTPRSGPPAKGALVTAARRYPTHPHFMAAGLRHLPATTHSHAMGRKIEPARSGAGGCRSCGDAREHERKISWYRSVICRKDSARSRVEWEKQPSSHWVSCCCPWILIVFFLDANSGRNEQVI